MKCLLILAALALSACGTTVKCSNDKCAKSALVYKVCGELNATTTYSFGGMSWSCPVSNASECATCAASVASWCGG